MIAEKEMRWLCFFIIFVLGLTTIPYLIGFAVQGENWRFTGFFFGVEDGNSYIAKMLSGFAGEWLFRTPYTAFPQLGMLAFLPYILFGKLAASPALHEQLLALFQIFRWGGGIAVIVSTYRLMAYFISEISLRRWGTIIATVGGGFGWLSALGLNDLWFSHLPLEFYSPETFGFLSIVGLPHLELARALLLWGFVDYLRISHSSKRITWRYAQPGLAWLLAGLMQPLTVVTGWIVLFVHQWALWIWNCVFKRQSFQTCFSELNQFLYCAFLTVIVSSPIVVYTIISFISDPFLSEWSKQNLILSPPFGDYLLAFGMILPFCVLYLFKRRISISPNFLFLFGWILVFPLMAYAPINLQRRLPDGIWIALVVIGLLGMSTIKNRSMLMLSKVWLGISLLSSVIFLAGSSATAAHVQAPSFRPYEEVQAFKFIHNSLPQRVVVLAPYSNANPLPAWAAVRTVIGHGPESVYLKEIQPRVEAFYANGLTIAEGDDLLREFDVSYILVTPQEKQFAYLRYIEKSHIELIYDQSGYLILRVNQ